MNEPTITINGRTLSEAQAMTVRVALNNFATQLAAKGLGKDEHGKAMTAGYLQHIAELQRLMVR